MSQGRTNLLDPYNCKSYIELILSCGRRSGKTFLITLIVVYETYKLILKGNPQQYYKIPQGDEIAIVNIVHSNDHALLLTKNIKNRILKCKWFEPYIASSNQTEIRLRTKRDLELFQNVDDDRASIKIISDNSSPYKIVGHNTIVLILDELAHFFDKQNNYNGESVYEELTPTVATYGSDGKVISVSTPNLRYDYFYKLYSHTLECTPKNICNCQSCLIFQIPIWEMNDKVSFDFLRNEKIRDPKSFYAEFGAQF